MGEEGQVQLSSKTHLDSICQIDDIKLFYTFKTNDKG